MAPVSSDTWHLQTLLSAALIFTPIIGCSSDESDSGNSGESNGENVGADDHGSMSDLADSASEAIGETWDIITEKTTSGLTIVGQKVSSGAQSTMDATKAAWVWSADQSADGWNWIVENTGDATEWAGDTAAESWAITKQTSGEMSLWVQVKAHDGVAWAKTSLPKAWKVTKDAAGNAWVWVGEHKVEMAIAAAVVAVVVAGLIVAPEGVGPAVVRGAVSGSAAHGVRFLAAAWKNRDNVQEGQNLGDASRDVFMAIGKSVLTSCGSEILGSMPEEVPEA